MGQYLQLSCRLKLDNKMKEDYCSKKSITLSQFIRESESHSPGASGKFTNIMLAIALGAKIVSRGVNRAGLASMLGLTGEKNVQGEKVQKLDEYADNVFNAVLGRCGEFTSLVSEEQDSVVNVKGADKNSNYVIAFDPLDGSSNIDVNVSIGSIWAVYHKRDDVEDDADEAHFYQSGRKLVAAGYTIYGSSTMFVYSTGEGVNGFTLDPTIGEFVLTHPDMKMPEDGSIYSCNQANARNWDEKVVNFLNSVSSESAEKKLSLRYVGSLVADFHRTLLKGGIFMYPADSKNKNGKLRLLYECAPMAFIAEQAGGRAISHNAEILDIVPSSIHQRCPLFIGSKNLVDSVQKYLS